MTGYIYKITSPTGGIYIGQTDNLIRRFQEHRTAKRGKLRNSIKSHGWDAHTIDILFEGETSNKHLNLLEIEYIKVYKSNYKRYPDRNGLNLTDGGEGHRGPRGPMSEDHKIKLSQIHKGRKLPPRSEKWRANLSKIVLQYTPEGILVEEWLSVKDAAESLGLHPSNISSCLKGVQKTARGFIWKYK